MENAFGNTVKKLRIEKGWKQKDLAERSDISRVSIGSYERGKRIPTVEQATKIASSLDTTVDYLVNGKRIATEPIELSDGLTEGFKLDGNYINITEQQLIESFIENIRHNRKEPNK